MAALCLRVRGCRATTPRETYHVVSSATSDVKTDLFPLFSVLLVRSKQRLILLLSPPAPAHAWVQVLLPAVSTLLVTSRGHEHADIHPGAAKDFDGPLQFVVLFQGPRSAPQTWVERALITVLALCGCGVFRNLTSNC